MPLALCSNIHQADIDSGNEISEGHPHDLAGLLKMFLRSMPDPLLTYRLYDALNNAAKMPNKQDQTQAVLMLMFELPTAHLHALIYVMQLLADVVAITGNKVGIILILFILCLIRTNFE